MKRPHILFGMLACTLLLSSFSLLNVHAGKTVQMSQPVLEDDALNQTDWYFADANIVSKEGVLVIPADTSTGDTRLISKNVCKIDKAVDEMTGVYSKLCFTNLPEGKQMVFAFGLPSIEAYSGGNGQVEIVFVNEGGIKMSVMAYAEDGAKTLVNKMSTSISLNKEFTIQASITPQGVLSVKINDKKLCESSLPVSGVGRFGILQSGSCGAKISELRYKCSHYEAPENTNINEDFEDGEININELYSTSRTNGLYPSYIRIEKEEENSVLRFKNCGLSYIATKHKYSNFELSFDIPYILRENVYDEDGVLVGKPTSNIGVSFGSEQVNPEGYTYVHDIDLITLLPDSARSFHRKIWSASLVDLGIADMTNNEGYSFKLSVIDGHTICQAKKISSDKWITIGEGDYELQRSGYIFIWSTGNADCTIDNLKITNLDENPNLIDVDYKSSVIKAEDYELTEEETTLVFREDIENGKAGVNAVTIFVICSAVGALFLVVLGIVLGAVVKRKKAKEVNANEKI